MVGNGEEWWGIMRNGEELRGMMRDGDSEVSEK